jgi:UPF0755 protein
VKRSTLVASGGAALALGLLAVGIAAWYAWSSLQRPFKAFPGESVTLTIPEGASATAVLEQLEREGVLRDAALVRLYLIRVLDDPPLKAGEYRFEGEASAIERLDKVVRGAVVTHRLTLIEGLTLEETADSLAASGFGDRERFLAAMRDPTVITDLDPAASDLEGYLHPETYAFAGGTPEEAIVANLVETFRRRFEERVRPLLAEDDARSVRDLVTLASIVEKEAVLDEERPTIAGVYANRLRRGIALYADPTIIFALKLRGTWDGNLRKPDLDLDSPYNTYRNPGLPPGPIASPGIASLEAAARPAEVPYLYFVSRNDGSHVFAATLAEHNRNVEKWQRQYWRDRWARERRERAQREANGG